MILDVKIDKATMRKLAASGSPSQNDIDSDDSGYSSDSSSDEEKKEDPKKPPNDKDKNLRVSLIQSKWVVC